MLALLDHQVGLLAASMIFLALVSYISTLTAALYFAYSILFGSLLSSLLQVPMFGRLPCVNKAISAAGVW